MLFIREDKTLLNAECQVMKCDQKQTYFLQNKHLQIAIQALRSFHYLAENSLQCYFSIQGAKNNVELNVSFSWSVALLATALKISFQC